MLLAAPDCFSSSAASSTLSSSLSHNRKFSFLFSKASVSINSPIRTRSIRLCTASLITNPDSFEVGKLIGSYGFMNVTRYCLAHSSFFFLFGPRFLRGSFIFFFFIWQLFRVSIGDGYGIFISWQYGATESSRCR